MVVVDVGRSFVVVVGRWAGIVVVVAVCRLVGGVAVSVVHRPSALTAGRVATASVIVEEVDADEGDEAVVWGEPPAGVASVRTGTVGGDGTGSSTVGASATDAHAESTNRAPIVAFRTQPVCPIADGDGVTTGDRRSNGGKLSSAAMATSPAIWPV